MTRRRWRLRVWRQVSPLDRHRAIAGVKRPAPLHPHVHDVERIVRLAPRITIRRIAAPSLQIVLGRTTIQPVTGSAAHARTIHERSHARTIERVLTMRERASEVVRRHDTRVLERLNRAPADERRAETMVIARPVRLDLFPRVAMTLARVAPAARSEEAAAVPAHSLDALPISRAVHPQRSRQPESIVLPPQELSRVADHVIQQLDRRIVSYRERTGRI